MPQRGRPSADFVRHQFKTVAKADGTPGNKTVCHFPAIHANFKGQAACKHCEREMSDVNSTRKRKHLVEECLRFLDHARAKGIRNDVVQEAIAFHAKGGQQKLLTFPIIPKEERQTLDHLFANVCYLQALPFNLYESEAMKNALHRLNSAYKPPNRKAVGGPLLLTSYDSLQLQVLATVANLEYINVISDESSNINRSRIFNTCLHTPQGALHWISQDIGAKRLTAENSATMLHQLMGEISNGKYSRINSLSTDTCDTMLKTHWNLQQYPELKHVFFIPCDSHGLQLLVKDVLSLRAFKTILDNAQKIAKAFKKSPLQLARLRDFQNDIYGEHKSLCLSVITRWGTQYRLIESVLNSKDALRRYATSFTGQLPYGAANSIDDQDQLFWPALERLRELLHPIDEAVRMSESDKSHLGTVLQRWETMNQHLTSSIRYYPDLATFMNPETEGGFSQRFARQITPIHIAAYYLTPKNRELSFQLDQHSDYRRQLYKFLREYSSSPDDAKLVEKEYVYYVTQRECFEKDECCWGHEESPKDFWLFASLRSRYLAPLCLRIFNAPCNSVPSERAFSIQNIIHSKIRNQLSSAKVDKLTYIYMNSRVLGLKSPTLDPSSKAQIKQMPRSPYDLSEEQMVQMEDELLEEEVIREMDGMEEDSDCSEDDDDY